MKSHFLVIFTIALCLSHLTGNYPVQVVTPEDIPHPDTFSNSPQPHEVGTEALTWNMEMIGMEEAWKKTMGDEEIIVAIIDAGINWTQPELPTSLRWENQAEVNGASGVDDDGNGYVDDLYGFDFQEYDNSSRTDARGTIHWHGTFIAGLIAATHNGEGIAGIAPAVRIMDIRVLNNNNLFSGFDRIIDAFNYAIAMGASVINFSIFFGSPFIDPQVHSVFEKASKANIPIVGITGNDYSDRVSAPGTDEYVIATGAVNTEGEVTSFSNTGPEVEIVAPGLNIESTGMNGQPAYGYGTSFAAPHVTGAIALMKSLRNDLSVKFLRKTLHYAATDVEERGRDVASGYGLLNVSKSLAAWTNFEHEDFDLDGLNNEEEMDLGTEIDNNDTDGDLLPDAYEVDHTFDPVHAIDTNEDADGDGVTNYLEYLEGTDPHLSDTDEDEMSDGYEILHDLDPLTPDGDMDKDDDGWTNAQEARYGTDPNDPDSRPAFFRRLDHSSTLYSPLFFILLVVYRRKVKKR